MAVTATQLNTLYFAYFGRPADFDGYNFYLNNPAATSASVAAAFSASPESQALYGSAFGAAQVNAIYQNLFNREAEPAGLTYWANEVNSGRLTAAGAALGIAQGAQNTDLTTVTNKLAISQAFFNALDTSAEIVGYTGSAAAASARAFIKTVDSTAASVTAANTNLNTAVTAAVGQGTSAPGAGGGLTLTLTSSIDNLAGAGGNDIFIGDSNTITAADQLNGGNGIDTVRLFGTVTLPQLTSIESIYLSKNGAGLDVSAIAGVTQLETDAATAGYTYTLATGQTLKASNTGAVTTTIASGGTVTALGLTANKLGTVAAPATVDLTGAALTTLNLATDTAASSFTVTNTPSKLATLNVSGDKAVTVVANLTALKTVNASANTGGVTFDANTLATDNVLTFTGGSGNDTVIFKTAFLTGPTGGDVLDGGAGTDTIAINDTTPVYTAVNAAKNFEVLQLNTTGGTVDRALLTTIDSFATGAGNISANFNNSLATTTYSIDNSGSNTGTVTIANKTGELTANVTVSTGTATTAATLNALTVTGVSTLNLTSAGSAANTITTVTSADNSVFNIKGSTALTMTLAAGTAVGSKIDGSAFTGKLTANGSTFNDILIGGSAGDVLNGGKGTDTLTGGAGADTFSFTATAGASSHGATFGTFDTITDFVVGTDKLQFAGVNDIVSGQQAAVQAAVTALAGTSTDVAVFTAMANASTTNLGVSIAVFGGNTYVLYETSGAGTGAVADDVAIKLTGVATAPTFTADVVA